MGQMMKERDVMASRKRVDLKFKWENVPKGTSVLLFLAGSSQSLSLHQYR
jgi:hypothetical protein